MGIFYNRRNRKMTWNLTDKTAETIQAFKTELPEFDTVKNIFCIGSHDGFGDLIDIECDVWDEDIQKKSFTVYIKNGDIAKPEDVKADAIYINGIIARRNLPSIITWALKTNVKYVLVDKTHEPIVKERYYTYVYKTRKSNHNVFCHFRYVDEKMNNQMITVLKRYNI
jgi:hypothetical protein